MMPASISRYLASRGIRGPWKIAGTDRGDFRGAIVIPALAERDSLLATISSLAENPPDLLSRFLILIVVNHRRDANQDDKADNRETLALLSGKKGISPALHIGWVDAASLDDRAATDLEKLAPFGAGNPEPVFGVRVRPSRARQVGAAGVHLKLVLADRDAIAFQMGDRLPLCAGTVEAAVSLGFDDWDGMRRLQLRVRDLRAAPPPVARNTATTSQRQFNAHTSAAR